jgi:hypothetical protein
MTRPRPRPTALLTVLALLAALVASLTTMSTSSAFTATITNNTNTAATAATAPYFTCLDADTAPGAGNTYFIYPPSSTATTVVDASGNSRTGTLSTANASVGAPGSGPCPRDTPNRSFTLSGSNNDGYIAGPTTAQTNPSVFTVEVWFNTTTTGGKLIGFGDKPTGLSGMYDRHIYMDDAGKLWFGVYPSKVVTVNTTTSYNDGRWHLATATLSAAGMRLYVDGKLAATPNPNTVAQNYAGYWRVGYDSLNSWTNQPKSFYFNGKVAYPAVYTTALTATQIQDHYLAAS